MSLTAVAPAPDNSVVCAISVLVSGGAVLPSATPSDEELVPAVSVQISSSSASLSNPALSRSSVSRSPAVQKSGGTPGSEGSGTVVKPASASSMVRWASSEESKMVIPAADSHLCWMFS